MQIGTNPIDARTNPSTVRIVDVINLAASAKEMLLNRMLHLHNPPEVENWIVCPPADPADLRGSEQAHIAAFESAGIPVRLVKCPRGASPSSVARYLFELVTLFRRIRPDIVHTHCSIPGLAGRIAARLAGVPIVVHTVHGFLFHAGSSRLHRLCFSTLERMLASFTDILLTENREDRLVVRRWRWPKASVKYVCNGIDVDRYARFMHRHDGQGRVVACIGRFEPVKNHRDLLRVFARVHRECPNARLRLLGDGPLRPECEQLAAELGIAHVTEFLGYRDDVDALLADVDVAALLSWKEGMSRALLEPMAAGVPAVAWRVKGNRECVRSGHNGFLAAPGDLDATAKAIVDLLRDDDLRRRLGAAAARDVRGRFDENAVVDRLRSVYGALLRAKGYRLRPQSSLAAARSAEESRALVSA